MPTQSRKALRRLTTTADRRKVFPFLLPGILLWIAVTALLLNCSETDEQTGHLEGSPEERITNKQNVAAIVVDAPLPGALVSSPLMIKGRARGTWFFEGDFPVLLKDGSGKVIAQKYVTAKGNWILVCFATTVRVVDKPAPNRYFSHKRCQHQTCQQSDGKRQEILNIRDHGCTV